MRNRKAGCNAGLSVCIGCRRCSRRKMQEQYQATMITGLAGAPGVDQCGVSDLFRREYAVAVPIDPSIGLFNGHEKFGLGDRFVAIGVQGFETVRGNEPARRREARSAALRSPAARISVNVILPFPSPSYAKSPLQLSPESLRPVPWSGRWKFRCWSAGANLRLQRRKYRDRFW